MIAESDRVSRAGSFVLGLMNDTERQRAERDLEVDPVFREAVLELAGRLQVLDLAPEKNESGAEQWKLIAARIAALPQMRGVVENGIAPAGRGRTIGRVLEQFQQKWELGKEGAGNPAHAAPVRQAAVYVISLIAAFAAGYLAALWLI
jgi:hypothetical protein